MLTRKGLIIIALALLAASYPRFLRDVTVAEDKPSASQNAVLPRRYAQLKKLVPAPVKKAPVPAAFLVRRMITMGPTAPSLLPVVDQPDIEDRHQKIANDVLMALPEKCRNTLQKLYVRYDNPSQRGLAGKNTLIVTGNVSDQEFLALLVHELGHVFDLNSDTRCLAGSPAAGLSEFKDGADPVYKNDPSLSFYRIAWVGPKEQKAGVKPADFVSGYAAHDVFEDFAESHAYFVLHNEVFKERAAENKMIAAKYEWFRTNMYSNGVNFAQTREIWTGSVPWDITKLTYDWTGVTKIANR